MRKIAPEIEELMWTIAQQRDPQAIDEFGQRFPELRQELGKRLTLTQGLRSASVAGRPQSIPRFTPREAPPRWWTRPAAVALACGVLVVLALGSYNWMRGFSTPETITKTVIVPKDTPNDPLERGIDKAPTQPTPEFNKPTGPVAQKLPDEVPPYMKPQSLNVEAAKLPDVFRMIEQSCGLAISMPDMPADLADLDVEAHYEGINGLQMLADMGSKYGFTAFQQEGNQVLIVPARPTNADTNGGP